MTAHPAPIELRAFAEEICGAFRSAAAVKSLRLECRVDAEAPERVVSDAIRLRQILANLLANAIKLTERGAVALEVRAAAERLYFAVSDTGPGIPADRQATIFEAYDQGGRAIGGTGLGLAISAQLAAQLGGRIEVRSDPGAGATFVLSIPLVRVD